MAHDREDSEMGTELAQLASDGAATFVSLVVTDAWQQAKERIGALLARGGDSRLEAAQLEVARTELLIADENGDQAARNRIQNDWETRLRDLLGRDPSAVEALRAVLDDFTPHGGPPLPSITVRNNVSGRQRTVVQIGTVGNNLSIGGPAEPGPETVAAPVA
jgi:hypothetical protein